MTNDLIIFNTLSEEYNQFVNLYLYNETKRFINFNIIQEDITLYEKYINEPFSNDLQQFIIKKINQYLPKYQSMFEGYYKILIEKLPICKKYMELIKV
jgi:hypothetical protein